MVLYILTIANIKKGPTITDSASYSMDSCPLVIFIQVVTDAYPSKITLVNVLIDPRQYGIEDGIVLYRTIWSCMALRAPHGPYGAV